MDKSPDDIRLILGNNTPLDVAKTAHDCNIDNDGVVHFVYKQGDGWEEIDVPKVVKEQ